MRRGRPEPFFVRQVPTIGRCRAAARTDIRVGRPAVRFDHSPFEYDGRLSRITNNGFPRTQMRRSAATNSNRQRRFRKPSARSGTPCSGRPLRYRIQAMEMNAVRRRLDAGRKKKRPTAVCVGDAQSLFLSVRYRPSGGAGRLPERTSASGVPL